MIPAYKSRSGANVADAFDAVLPCGVNPAPTTDLKQADLGKMPFVTGGKLFFTLDGVNYVASGNIFLWCQHSEGRKLYGLTKIRCGI